MRRCRLNGSDAQHCEDRSAVRSRKALCGFLRGRCFRGALAPVGPVPRGELDIGTRPLQRRSHNRALALADVDEFVRVFTENVNDYKLAQDVQGTKYLRLEKLSPAEIVVVESAPAADEIETRGSGPQPLPTGR